jgi:dCTP deaminase
VDNSARSLFPEVYNKEGANGILPWQEIKRMVDTGQINATPDVPDSQIQPASIDLRLGKEAYRVQASFLRGRSATLLTKVRELLDSTIDLTQPTPPLLEPGVVYIIPLLERLRLPNDVQGIANPKSTTGRLDVFTRLITEHGDQFDRVPRGYKGLLYVEVSSRTFPIRVREGMTLNQLRFVRGNSLDPIRNGELRQLAKEHNLIYDSEGRPTTDRIGEGIELTVDLEGDDRSSIIAYRAKDSPRAIELDKVGHYDPADYWEAIPRPRQGHIILAKGGFYLLASKGRVSVPLNYAAEMVAHDPSMGEFRVHYAGFFDPGFGYGSKKGEICGTKAVLEVRAYEVPILLEDDDVVGRLHYYPMAGIPDKVYGTSIGSSYQQQGLALSKQFKRPSYTENTASSPAPALSPPALVG